MEININIQKKIEVSEEDIDFLMVAALEGGINYWADGCQIITNPKKKEYASEALAYGGSLKIHEDIGKWHVLDVENFSKGIVKAMEHYDYCDFQDFMDNHDAEVADVVVQFALFGKIVYG